MARILLVEDDESMRTFLAGALERAGHEVMLCDCGEDGFEALKAHVFDLLLTDIVMPGMDGIELAQKAVILAPEMRVVFITGFAAMVFSGNRSTPKGAGILSKPFHLRELVEKIERVIAGQDQTILP